MWFKKKKEMKWFKVIGYRETKYPECEFFKTRVKAENELMAKLKVTQLHPNKPFYNLTAIEIRNYKPKIKIPKIKAKGQFTIISLIMVFITLVMFSVMYPIIKPFIESLASQVDPVTAQVLYLMPFFLVLGIILTIIFYVIPHREGG